MYQTAQYPGIQQAGYGAYGAAPVGGFASSAYAGTTAAAPSYTPQYAGAATYGGYAGVQQAVQQPMAQFPSARPAQSLFGNPAAPQVNMFGATPRDPYAMNFDFGQQLNVQQPIAYAAPAAVGMTTQQRVPAAAPVQGMQMMQATPQGMPQEPDPDDDPNRLPTFVKVRGLPAEHDPRIVRRPGKKKNRRNAACCA